MATTDEWALLKCDLQEETFTIETTAVSVQTNLLDKVIASYWKTRWLVRTALDQHPFTRSVNISSSHDFRFSGACERKACRRCLDLMTTLVDAVLPTSWHITEWVKTPIWTKQKKPQFFREIIMKSNLASFVFPCLFQNPRHEIPAVRGKANVAH